LVWTAEEDLARPVLPEFTAEGAFDRDGLEREFLPPGRHVASAALAGDDEGLAA
jgi:hypothetical protein